MKWKPTVELKSVVLIALFVVTGYSAFGLGMRFLDMWYWNKDFPRLS